MDARVASLQRNIDFLQNQHKETLEKLHCEIDSLKRENKGISFKIRLKCWADRSQSPFTFTVRKIAVKVKGDRGCNHLFFSANENHAGLEQNNELQYKLIMELPNSSSKRSSRIICKQHHTERNKFQRDRRNYLEQTLEETCSPQVTEISSHLQCRETRSNFLTADKTEGPSEDKAGFITSLHPLMIQCSTSQVPRPPTLQECEVIIRQLYNANSLQSQEILRVKAVLKDIVFNKKITAENYILTKAYLADGKRADNSDTFPQLSLQTLPKGLPVSQASKAEKVILPALKQTLNNIADRHRRTQAVQRRRLQRTSR